MLHPCGYFRYGPTLCTMRARDKYLGDHTYLPTVGHLVWMSLSSISWDNADSAMVACSLCHSLIAWACLDKYGRWKTSASILQQHVICFTQPFCLHPPFHVFVYLKLTKSVICLVIIPKSPLKWSLCRDDFRRLISLYNRNWFLQKIRNNWWNVSDCIFV